ncbi:hypothetical protein GO495_06410 [Chitinophaga oryziterrae]|uniref:ABC-three component systems C-terminal domain-containing protein n=1 Tax=Chitinophaga oryziterrae TaxID=1031224 RepID=A0A6N8J7F3_9BACT|nr:ABC-three component system protein [Chitinophaga oryziterrae]MVT40206.1 hypothetical protein [Chitinophaga oryziterrae]
MTSNAPAQLLGYAVQFPRALLHLLRGGPGDTVSVEVLGDVATHKPNNSVTSEEDKISTVSNPLTDRSIELWKTLYNWLQAVALNAIDVKKTKFLLYTNKSGREAIVNSFDEAVTLNEAKKAIADAKLVLSDIKNDHDIWVYFEYVINFDNEILAELITRFELQIDNGLGFTEINYELDRLLIGKNQFCFVSNLLNGWLQEEIMTKISLKKPALIPWEDYQKQFRVCFDRARKLELIDFALQNPPNNVAIQNQVKIQPYYLQQLNHIKVGEDDIVNAVSDFLRSKVNRDMWIENEMIDEDVASEFESRLTNYWSAQRKRLDITEKSLEEHERGKLLFLDCKMRQEVIRDMTPPAGTIAGTYHVLVEGRSLGWHPKWENL